MKREIKMESRKQLVTQVIRGAREFSIGTVLFHRAVGQILGVNVTDMKCLDMMTLQGSATPSQLAAHTGLSSGATTAMIDRLERAGLVERQPHPKDRRGTILVLTEEAMRKLPSLFSSLGTAMETLVSSYPQKELAVLNDFFTKARVLWQEERAKLQRAYSGRPH
jgi:DNA-binding MarR family transcriptional regulator